MAALEGIRACVFDAYGTLFDVNSPVQKLATEIGDKAADLAGCGGRSNWNTPGSAASWGCMRISGM